MTTKELKQFLSTIATQRRRMCSMQVTKKPTKDVHIRQVENAATFADPSKWMWDNEHVVYLVCPKSHHKKMQEIYKFLNQKRKEKTQ